MASMGEAQLQCRMLRAHSYLIGENNDSEIPSTWHLGRAKVVTWECSHCGVRRIDAIDPHTGRLELRTYVYPDGWVQFHDVGGAPRVTALRVEYFRRTLNRKAH